MELFLKFQQFSNLFKRKLKNTLFELYIWMKMINDKLKYFLKSFINLLIELNERLKYHGTLGEPFGNENKLKYFIYFITIIT